MIQPDYKRFPYHGVGFTVRNSDLLTALLPLEKRLYKLEDNHLIVPTPSLVRHRVFKDVRNALVEGNIKIVDENTTKDGQYRSDWIVLEELAFRICALRRGGFGAILELRQTFNAALDQWNRVKPIKDTQQALIQSAYDKLTPAERKATGLIYKRGIKK